MKWRVCGGLFSQIADKRDAKGWWSQKHISLAEQAFVTLVSNDEYAEGAHTLGFSLKDSGTTRKLICMVTKGVSDNVRALLRQQWDDLVEVETMDSNDPDALALLGRPELGMTFTKLFAWQLTDYEKAC